MKKLTPLLTVLLLASCNQQEQSCTDSFLSDLDTMKSSFKKAYQAEASAQDVQSFKSSMSRFLSAHDGVECNQDGELIAPSTQVKNFQEVFNQKNNFRSISAKGVAKVIYGDDDRRDVNEASDNLKKLAASTAAQMSPDEWDTNFNLIGETLGERYRLCSGQRYSEQKSSARCSGFLVGPDVIVTAGHCVQSDFDCDNFKWVFDYKNDAKKVDPAKVYSCSEILSQKLDSDTGADYAVIKLDKKVEDRAFFKIENQDLSVGQNVGIIGHPSGLPTKIAEGAFVRKNDNDYYFEANLDSFGGNSGSVVYDTGSGHAVGILVRGEVDYRVITDDEGNRCRVVNECTNDGCDGEDVTKISSVEGIPAIIDFEQIKDSLYANDQFQTVKLDNGLLTYAYDFKDYRIGGIKFLELCGIHYSRAENASSWKSSFVGECSQEKDIDGVIAQFADQFYL